MNGFFLFTLAVAVLHAPPSLAAVGPADEPSIEEMLAVIERELAPRDATAAQAPPAASDTGRASQDASRSSGSHGPVEAWRPDSPAVTELIRALEARASERLVEFKRKGQNWDIACLYLELEKFTEAASMLGRMQSTRLLGRNVNVDRVNGWGEVDLEYAVSLAFMGRDRLAEAAIAAHERRLRKAKRNPTLRLRPGTSDLARLEARKEFVRGFPAVRGELDGLGEVLARGPDPDTQWRLIKLVDPRNGRAQLPVTWIAALVDLRDRHPDHAKVTSGEADWELYRAYRHHRMYGECVEILESMEKRFSAFGAVKNGDCLWELAKSYRDLARQQLSRRPTDAVESCQRRLACLERFKKEFPEDWRSKPRTRRRRPNLPPPVDMELRMARTALDDARRTLGVR
jgi:hypothetical protein